MWKSRSLPVAAAFVCGAGAGAAVTRQSRGATRNDNDSKSAPESPQPSPVDRFARPVTLMDAIGNTPLLELTSVSRLTGCKIYAKAEFMNPCGSIKDRPAKYLILDAEARGVLPSGGTIIEATGGSTGIALTQMAAARGYKTALTMTERTAQEKVELMKVLGATVHVHPDVSLYDEDRADEHYYRAAKRLQAATPDSVHLDQFENAASMRAHYETTAPEIWRQTQGHVDGFVVSSGSAGTISGVSAFLKERSAKCLVWLIEPVEMTGLTTYVNSNRSNSYRRGDYELFPARTEKSVTEGIGLPRVTANFRQARVDKGITGTNQEVVDMAYFLLRNDGIFVGPSSALNVIGAVKMARELGPGHTIVTVLCDTGARYRSKLYNREWLQAQNLVPPIDDPGKRPTTLDFVQQL
ncbi:TPA: hypothetical protein N0F65_003313 [Lagenidium giganteum]|uniref:Tryptophan synthase beta chain-like PALP domain-containing protein n=1 Tax=Lagenidium giganteum TaxID=4803 RepID=A0AAV2Z9S5_9STRA|nr:TPA: hypothetical protein N0F65_003313 [Lagenidium giganteum]